MKKLKNNNNKVIAVVIENTQYEVINGIASFAEQHISIAKALGFKDFAEEVEAVEQPQKQEQVVEANQVEAPSPIKKTRTKKQ